MAGTVLLLVDDLMFGPRLENGLRGLGYRPLFATNETELTQGLMQAPVLAVVDLGSAVLPWEPLVDFIKGPGKKGRHVPVLGFGPHVDLDLRARALARGCDAVVGRSAIVQNLGSLVNKHAWRVERPKCRLPLPPLVVQGLEEFNRGQYFECHETLELAWNEEPDSIRLLYQGILLVAVACHHVERGNWRGALKVLGRGMPKIAHFAPVCQGINVEKLLADAGRLRAALLELGPDRVAGIDRSLLVAVEYALAD